jgi:Putative adhesin
VEISGVDLMNAPSLAALSLFMSLLFPFLSSNASAQQGKEFSFPVTPRPVVSIINNYGSITVKPSGTTRVVVKSTAQSGDVTFENEQHGNRISLRSISGHPETNIGDYTVLVPTDSSVVADSRGTIQVKGLSGHLMLETRSAAIEVSDIDNAHIHVRSLDGPITLNDIHDSQVDVYSNAGTIKLSNVARSWLDVVSGSGRVEYRGDPGSNGEYSLMSDSGDLEISIPASAFVQIDTPSVNRQSDKDNQERPSNFATNERKSLFKERSANMSRFVVRSLSGRIRLRRP